MTPPTRSFCVACAHIIDTHAFRLVNVYSTIKIIAFRTHVGRNKTVPTSLVWEVIPEMAAAYFHKATTEEDRGGVASYIASFLMSKECSIMGRVLYI